MQNIHNYVSLFDCVPIFLGIKVYVFERPPGRLEFALQKAEIDFSKFSLSIPNRHLNCLRVNSLLLLELIVNESHEVVGFQNIYVVSSLAHVNMNLINSAVIDQPLEVPLELRQQLHVIDEVPINFLQLLQDTLRVVVRLAAL